MLISSNIKLLVVHCSDTDNEDDLSALDIHKMHLNFGWEGIGYHKVILRSGKIENGRPEFWIGAHVKGKNKNSLGVCLIGTNKFTNKQFSSCYYGNYQESCDRQCKQWIDNGYIVPSDSLV